MPNHCLTRPTRTSTPRQTGGSQDGERERGTEGERERDGSVEDKWAHSHAGSQTKFFFYFICVFVPEQIFQTTNMSSTAFAKALPKLSSTSWGFLVCFSPLLSYFYQEARKCNHSIAQPGQYNVLTVLDNDQSGLMESLCKVPIFRLLGSWFVAWVPSVQFFFSWTIPSIHPCCPALRVGWVLGQRLGLHWTLCDSVS